MTNDLQDNYFPQQKKPTKQKGEKWGKDCIEAAEQIVLQDHDAIRQDWYNKKKNYDLANDILDTNDVERVTNPYKISGGTFPATMQNYPIANPKIDLLVGEEAKRHFEYKVRVANENAVSIKEEEKLRQWQDKVKELIESEIEDESLIKEKLQEFQKYLNFEYQDLRERRAAQIMAHHEKKQDFSYKFNRGFFDALIAGEEIYEIDILGGEPVMRKADPLQIFTIRSGDSPYIEDSDIIIKNTYMSPGQVIDDYYDHLTKKQVDKIDSGQASNSSQGSVMGQGKEPDFVINGYMPSASDAGTGEGTLQLNNYGDLTFGGSTDEQGNIRVMRVMWKSLRKVQELKYYDEHGDEERKIVDEYYEPDESEGEEIVNEYWINEWWEGTKIGEDIFVKIQPSPVQIRDMDNISRCYPGFVGTAYNINNSKAMSLMDRMKPFQYMYNVTMYRLELAMAKSKGKIGQLDLSKVPSGWTIDKWLYYADVMGFAIVDSFKEGTQGRARGELAGNVNNTLGSAVMDLEMGQYIQQNVQILEYIEQQLGVISGVSEQRQGQISQQELVGNVERSVTQSSHITEKWFRAHDNTKKRVLRTFLETAKTAYRGKSKKVQYVLDDMSQEIFDIDGDEFAENNYDIFISDSTNDMEMLETLKQLAQAGLQNDKINFSQLIDIFSSESMSTMQRKIERAEEMTEKKAQRAQEQQLEEQKQQRQFEQKKFVTEQQLEKKKMNEESRRKLQEMQHERTMKEMELENEKQEQEQENSTKQQELEQKLKELEQGEKELQHQIEHDRAQLEQEDEHFEEEMEHKEKELEIEKKEAEANKAAAKEQESTQSNEKGSDESS